MTLKIFDIKWLSSDSKLPIETELSVDPDNSLDGFCEIAKDFLTEVYGVGLDSFNVELVY